MGAQPLSGTATRTRPWAQWPCALDHAALTKSAISTVTLAVGHIEDISYRPAHVKVSVVYLRLHLQKLQNLPADPNHPSSIQRLYCNQKSQGWQITKIDILSQCRGMDCQ